MKLLFFTDSVEELVAHIKKQSILKFGIKKESSRNS
jgi:hypothetical protein